jgi:hypothetical protein
VSGISEPKESQKVMMMTLLQMLGVPHEHHNDGKGVSIGSDDTVTRQVRYREYNGSIISQVAEICGIKCDYMTISPQLFVPADNREG